MSTTSLIPISDQKEDEISVPEKNRDTAIHVAVNMGDSLGAATCASRYNFVVGCRPTSKHFTWLYPPVNLPSKTNDGQSLRCLFAVGGCVLLVILVYIVLHIVSRHDKI